MSSLTKNEIITLKHLADGQQHNEAPSTLSEAQYYMALKSLKSRDMVYAAFCEGEEVETAQIKKSGQAVLEDLKSAEKRILRHIVAEEDLTQDQYELLQYAKKTGKCDNIFGIPWEDYKEQIWKELYTKKMIQRDDDSYGKPSLVLTRLGLQIVERIDDELFKQLSDDRKEEDQIQAEQQREKTEETLHKIKDSGFRINEDRITDVIKTVWSMHDVGMFVDPEGNKPTIISVMEAFGEFLQAKQFEKYSSYMNKALKTTKNTYLDVFYKMEESAEKHYNEKKERKIGK